MYLLARILLFTTLALIMWGDSIGKLLGVDLVVIALMLTVLAEERTDRR